MSGCGEMSSRGVVGRELGLRGWGRATVGDRELRRGETACRDTIRCDGESGMRCDMDGALDLRHMRGEWWCTCEPK